MAQFDKETLAIVRRLQSARMGLLQSQPFYALLLMHMKFALDISCETAYTDGERIAFNPVFINELTDTELEFVLLHELLHVVLLHCARTKADYDNEKFNEACDIVVNSNILHSFDMDLSKITLSRFGESIHKTPGGAEGFLYSAEDVYSMILATEGSVAGKGQDDKGSEPDDQNDEDNDASGKSPGSGDGNKRRKSGKGRPASDGFDDHSFWKGDDEDQTQTNIWLNRMIDATEIISKAGLDKIAGVIPAGIERLLSELTKAKTDWRTVLNDFIQEEINDYSFSPPDRRFSESEFFLPDFNEKDEKIHNILFMIDTSGSMSDEMITAAYSEIKGAIDQFGGKLQGWLGFFDAEVVEPKPFESEEEFSIIRPFGGGGTSFEIIFDYVSEKMEDNPPVSIVILTDGYAPFPDEVKSMGIPVLWMINNEEVTPPWGRTTRI